MVVILGHGDDHFIVSGPFPDREVARAPISTLVHHSDWSDTATLAEGWRMSLKEFREDLEWAVIVTGRQ